VFSPTLLCRSSAAGLLALAAVMALWPAPAPADGPQDNLPDNVRPVPPKGVAIPDADRAELKAGLADLGTAIDDLRASKDPAVADLLPDVEVYHKAVRYAVEYDEFFDPKFGDVKTAKQQLSQGLQRAKELKEGKPTWPTATGLVVRGYRSKIDGSVQPYGLVIPATYDPKGEKKHRLDFWWHGRYEKQTEVTFIAERQAKPGEFTPPDALVLHPYGRFSNANKFAGEVDTFECLDHAKKHYRIDENRVVARGFSMGGAACWQFAVHHPTLWAAAAPGAGFAETPEFLGNFQNEAVKPTWYEQRLWHWYNATDYAQNIFNVPTVAYSGEIDKQKQAADVMAREMKKVGLELTHIIGPKTAHKYEPGAKKEINQRIDAIVEKGRDPMPEHIRFVTHTLRYNRCGWIAIDGLERHWEPAVVTANLRAKIDAGSGARVGERGPPQVLELPWITTKNVTALTMTFRPGEWFFGNKEVRIDKDYLSIFSPIRSDRSMTAHFRRTDGKWRWVAAHEESALVKKHGLQGPIDDAFMDRFVMVRPTGTPLNEKVGAWADAEMKHAVKEWRRQFRGDAPVTDDAAVSDDEIKNANLVLWGDPSSNKVLAKVADRLPVKWTKDGVVVGDKTYDAATHVPLLIYPNPLNPSRYVVLNSGFTFREYDYLSNARQVPKLPDYAVIDTTTPPNSRRPGNVVRAGFFGEKWELQKDDGK
jgi:hypothetical protein